VTQRRSLSIWLVDLFALLLDVLRQFVFPPLSIKLQKNAFQIRKQSFKILLLLKHASPQPSITVIILLAFWGR
jgi:hypothetical protein